MSNMDNYNYFNDPRVINSLISGNAGNGLTHKYGKMNLYNDDSFLEDDERIVLKGSDGKFYEMCLYEFLENPSDDEIIGVLADDQSLEAFHGRFANPEDLKNKHLLEGVLFGDAFLYREGQDTRIPTSHHNCYQCDGKGTMVNPSIDAGGLSYDDFRDDPDFEEGYFSGRYDVTCSACNGSGKTLSIGWDAFPCEYVYDSGNKEKNPKYGLDVKSVLVSIWRDKIESYHQDMYDYARECAWERAMGC
jgi:hypothetical protein